MDRLTTIGQFIQQTERATFTFIEKHYIGLVTIFVMAFIAFGVSMFNHTLVSDEFGAIRPTGFGFQEEIFIGRWSPTVNVIEIRIGRWLAHPIRSVFSDAQPAASFSVAWLVTFQVLAAVIIMDMLALKDRFAFFTLAAVIIFHPLFIESISFKFMQISDGLAILWGCLYASLAQRALFNLLARRMVLAGLQMSIGVVLLVLATAIYQAFIFLGIAVYLLSVIYRTLFTQDIPLNTKNVILAVGVLILTGILTVALYAGSVWLTLDVSGLTTMPDQNGYSITGKLVTSAGELGQSLIFTGELLIQYFFRAQYGYPLIASLIFLVFVAIYITEGIRTASGNRAARLTAAVLLILGTAAVFIIPWLMNVIRTEASNNYRYKALTPNAFIYAMLIAIVIERTKTYGIRVWLRLLSLALILIFVFQHNAAAYNVQQYNQHDIATANRILTILETHEDYDTLHAYEQVTLIAVGNPARFSGSRYDTKPFRVSSGALRPMHWTTNACGVFSGCNVLRLRDLLALLSYNAQDYHAVAYRNAGAARTSAVEPILAEMQPYPHPSSVQIIEDNIVIMFTAPATQP